MHFNIPEETKVVKDFSILWYGCKLRFHLIDKSINDKRTIYKYMFV